MRAEPMAAVTLYTRPLCPYCVRAVSLLKQKGMLLKKEKWALLIHPPGLFLRILDVPATFARKQDYAVEQTAEVLLGLNLSEWFWHYKVLRHGELASTVLFTAVRRDSFAPLLEGLFEAANPPLYIKPAVASVFAYWQSQVNPMPKYAVFLHFGLSYILLATLSADRWQLHLVSASDRSSAGNYLKPFSGGNDEYLPGMKRFLASFYRENPAHAEASLFHGGPSFKNDLLTMLLPRMGLRKMPLPLPASFHDAPELPLSHSEGKSGELDLIPLAGETSGPGKTRFNSPDWIPRDQWKRWYRKRSRKWRMASSLCLTLATFSMALFQYEESIQLKEELLSAQTELELLEFQQLERELLQKEMVRLSLELKNWEAFRKRNNFWTLFLADLQTILSGVGDVWLDGMCRLEPQKGNEVTPPLQTYKLRLWGRMLDRRNPLAKVSDHTRARAEQFFRAIKESPFISNTESIQLDAGSPGMLAFSFVATISLSERRSP